MPVVLTILILSLSIGLIVYDRYFNKRAQLEKEFKETAEADFLFAKDGDYSKISGTVAEQTAQLIAPISGKPCIAFRVENSRTWEGAKESEYVKTIYDSLDFPLQSESEKVVVLVEGAQFQLKPSYHVFLGGDIALFLRIEKFLNYNKLSTSYSSDFPKIYELEESLVEFGSVVSVLGYHFRGPAGPIMESGEKQLYITNEKDFLI